MTRASAPVPVARCEACRRTKAEIKVGTLESRQIDGIGEHPTYLCTSVADCRRHWPVKL